MLSRLFDNDAAEEESAQIPVCPLFDPFFLGGGSLLFAFPANLKVVVPVIEAVQDHWSPEVEALCGTEIVRQRVKETGRASSWTR